jgi:hypothetical protein
MASVCGISGVCAVCIRAAFATMVSAPRGLRLSAQAWSTCPSCRHWCTLCAGLCVRGCGVRLRENAGRCGSSRALVLLCVRECVRAAFVTTVSAPRVQLPSAQAWPI